jgi:hypothetical protein
LETIIYFFQSNFKIKIKQKEKCIESMVYRNRLLINKTFGLGLLLKERQTFTNIFRISKYLHAFSYPTIGCFTFSMTKIKEKF